MFLAIDVGNTTISLGILKGKKVLKRYFIESNLSLPLLRSQLKRVFLDCKKYPKLEKSLICSVVPSLNKPIEALLKKILNIKASIVGRDIKVPIKNNYRNPNHVGQDRLVGAYAAKCLYGSPLIIIDFGTAITFDIISAKGEYEGGMILPGMRLSAESLFQKTALLPQIHHIKKPHSVVGKTTEESILSGLFYGYGTMCSGLIDLLSRRMKLKPKVIATGGHADVMKNFISSRITTIDPDLVFKGLALLRLKKSFS